MFRKLSFVIQKSRRRLVSQLQALLKAGRTTEEVESMLKVLNKGGLTLPELKKAVRNAPIRKSVAAPSGDSPHVAQQTRPASEPRMIHLSSLGLPLRGARVKLSDDLLPAVFFSHLGCELVTGSAEVLFAQAKVHDIHVLLPKLALEASKWLWLEVEFDGDADGRAEVLTALRTAMGFGYQTLLQPACDGFPNDWTTAGTVSRRAVFVGSRAAFVNPFLVETPASRQRSLDARTSNVWIDVGAHKAETTLPVAKKNPDLTVYAFEPNTALCSALQGKAKNLLPLPMAVSKEDGFATFNLNAYDASSSLLAMDEKARQEWKGGDVLAEVAKQIVPTTRLDTFMGRMNIAQIDYLKIDAQGADYQVIQSLGSRTNDVAKLTCEVTITDRQLYKGAARPEKILNRMANKGFVLVQEQIQSQEQEKNWTFVRMTDWAAGRISPFVPDEHLCEFAQQMHVLQPLGAVPAWNFHDVESSTEAAVVLRLAVWSEARRRMSRINVELPWWGGTKFRFRLGNDLSLPSFVEGRYDPNEFALMDTLIKPGATVLDIGGNEGLYSVFMAVKAGAQGQVHVFEPSPREHERLAANLKLNGFANVSLEMMALAEKNGTATLKLGEAGHAGLNTLGDFPFEMKLDSAVDVRLMRLDDYAVQAGLKRLDFIKLDAEGAEQRIIEGGRETLKRFQPVILMEVNHSALVNQGSSTSAVFGVLAELGYSFYRFGEETGLPVKLGATPDWLNENIIASVLPLI